MFSCIVSECHYQNTIKPKSGDLLHSIQATTNPQTTQLLTTITRIAFTSDSTEGACVDTFEYCGANPQILALSCSDSDITSDVVSSNLDQSEVYNIM
jgi:hypothetical protein